MKIASRVLRVRRAGVDAEVPIHVFAPRPEGRDWSCRYEIGWPGAVRSRTIFGLDAVQTLLLAMQAIGAEIYASEEHAAGRLRWEEAGRGYGFPVPSNIRDLLIGDDADS